MLWRGQGKCTRVYLSITDALLYYEIFRRLTRRYKRQGNVRDFNDSRRAHFFDLAWWTDEGTKKLKRLRKRSGSKQCRRIETKEGKIEIDRSEDKKNDEGGSG
jgi:hypothetical protein